uniref:Uncharacterized protein n=1 Tax=Anguilla anguilla TaxID=7936 RepID=A0A0E9QDJ5_ANGAN
MHSIAAVICNVVSGFALKGPVHPLSGFVKHSIGTALLFL